MTFRFITAIDKQAYNSRCSQIRGEKLKELSKCLQYFANSLFLGGNFVGHLSYEILMDHSSHTLRPEQLTCLCFACSIFSLVPSGCQSKTLLPKSNLFGVRHGVNFDSRVVRKQHFYWILLLVTSSYCLLVCMGIMRHAQWDAEP